MIVIIIDENDDDSGRPLTVKSPIKAPLPLTLFFPQTSGVSVCCVQKSKFLMVWPSVSQNFV